MVSWYDQCQVVSVGHVKNLFAIAQGGLLYDIVVPKVYEEEFKGEDKKVRTDWVSLWDSPM